MKPAKKRILVVDDDAAATILLQLYFEKASIYEVKVENTSTRALAVAEEFQPHLILLDVDMPAMDGGKLASLLRENPSLR